MSSKEKRFYFVAGLPRTGSTLLCNLLMQNPRFFATSTSGTPDIIRLLRNEWDQIPNFRALPEEVSYAYQKGAIRGVMQGLYEHVDRPVVFDKSREWPSLIEVIERALDMPMKIIATVRDPRDILASLELLHRKRLAYGITGQQRQNAQAFTSLNGRCEMWANGQGTMGSAYNVLRDAMGRGHASKILFIRFEDLTAHPQSTMASIYSFLGEELYEHDFDHVEQFTQEDDRVHGFTGLHDIRSQVKPVPSRWREVLGEQIAKQYDGYSFW